MDLKDASPPNGPSTLSTFLAERKAEYLSAVAAGTANEWTVVMGNEAGDLDTLASSLVYAYNLHTSGGAHAHAIALQQTPRADLVLRAENLHTLALAGIDTAALLTLSDLPPSCPPFPSTKFALVDHNRLAPAFGGPNARVLAVLDHHPDEGLHMDASPRVVKKAGSCASLVVEHLASTNADLPKELATLLLTAILIDTGGLKPGGKAEEVDRRAAAWLVPRSTLAPGEGSETLQEEDPHTAPALRALTAELQTRKASVDHLGTRDLLRRDYKEYVYAAEGGEVRVGLASVPIGLRVWLPKEGARFGEEVRGWMGERGLQVLGILTSFRDTDHAKPGKRGKHKREQMYVVQGDGARELAKRLFKGLEKSEELKLKEKDWEYWGVRKGEAGLKAEDLVVGVWKQKNLDATRKVTAPLVKDIIEGGKKGNL